MANFNKVLLMGNLTRDPQLSYLPSQTAVVDFGIAVNRKWTDRNSGERQEDVTYFRVSCWRALADVANTYLKKGSPAFVAGRVSADAYIDKSGEARASLNLTAQDLQLLGRKDDSAEPTQGKESRPF